MKRLGICAGMLLLWSCGDDQGGDESGPSTGPGSTSAATVESSEGSISGTDDSSTSEATGTDDTSTTGTTGEGSSGSDATTEGGGLGDPEVFRTPDVADVCAPTPERPCTPGDMAWVAAEYGAEVWRADATWADHSGAVYRLVAFVERVGPSNIDVFVVDEAGAPLVGIPVAFYYDSLRTPSRPDEWYPVKVEGTTDAAGRAGFALGGGAYLDACGAGGPHAIWVSEPGDQPDTTVASDLADRLGMLGGTEHRHLDLLFQRLPPQEQPAGAWCPLGA